MVLSREEGDTLSFEKVRLQQFLEQAKTMSLEEANGTSFLSPS